MNLLPNAKPSIKAGFCLDDDELREDWLLQDIGEPRLSTHYLYTNSNGQGDKLFISSVRISTDERLSGWYG